MQNVKLTIQYKGTRYKGWQRLGNTDETVQAKLEQVLSRLEDRKIEVIGSSRTDAGVHALAQVANVKLNKQLTEQEIQSYCNQYLPEDISVTNVKFVEDRFHSRYHTESKTYVYKIWNAPYTHPFMRDLSMHVEKPLSLEAMKKAAKYLIGEHDFTTFTNAKSKKKSMVRIVDSIDFKMKEQMIEIRFHGNGFLYHQIRKMVGTLIRVGLHDLEELAMKEMLLAKDRSLITFMAEARGLYLEKIYFKK